MTRPRVRTFGLTACGLSALFVLAAGVRAQKPGRVGTIVVAQGGGEEWNRGVLATAAAATSTGGPWTSRS